MSFEVAITALVGLLTLAVGYITARLNKPKISAESESLAVGTMLSTLTVVKEELAEEKHARLALTERVAVLEAKVREYKRGVDLLRGQIRSLGGDPIWPTE